MSKIIILSDFDGTATGLAGRTLTDAEFYQSLLTGYVKDTHQAYRSVPMKSQDEMRLLFEEKFHGKYNSETVYTEEEQKHLLSKEALEFFHEVLKNPEEIQVNFITRNRWDYIEALLRFQGFTDEELKELKLHCRETNDKYSDAQASLIDQKSNANIVYILDDNKKEYEDLHKAAKSLGYTEKQIRGYQCEPGTFNWGDYLKKIPQDLKLAEQAQKNQKDKVYNFSVTKLDTFYHYAIDKKMEGRYHFFAASTNIAEYSLLKGDNLKSQILSTFKDKIDRAKSLTDLQEIKEALRNSDEYKVLAQGQGVTTCLFKLKTSSVAAFEKMINDQVKNLEFDDTTHEMKM